jgi:GNAT superfamily N-acetyltransferase
MSRTDTQAQASGTPAGTGGGRFVLTEVEGSRLEQAFLDMPDKLYRDDPNWVRPLDTDLRAVFDAQRNTRLQQGKRLRRWLLADADGQWVGRVAAFDHPTDQSQAKVPVGGMGFYECIPEGEAADALFEVCQQWLASLGYQGMEGPINLGERDRWWGLLVDGFHLPIYGMNYHRPYYQQQFEAYGFQTYFKQFTFRRPIEGSIADSLPTRSARVIEQGAYRFCPISRRRLPAFAEDFRRIYNAAWAEFSTIEPMTTEQAQKLMRDVKPILDERLMWFGYHGDEPVAFFIMLPQINQIIRHFRGRFGWWQKLRFWYLLRTHYCTDVFGVIFGVVPEHQGKGVETAIVMAFRKETEKPGFPYTHLELNWIGDFNPRMLHFARLIKAKRHKTHITYRKLFDPSLPFERHPVLR